MGRVVRILPILISISALGSANGSLFAAARYCLVGAQYGYLPEVFADLLNEYEIKSVTYANGPGSFMAIKMSYLFFSGDFYHRSFHYLFVFKN